MSDEGRVVERGGQGALNACVSEQCALARAGCDREGHVPRTAAGARLDVRACAATITPISPTPITDAHRMAYMLVGSSVKQILQDGPPTLGAGSEHGPPVAPLSAAPLFNGPAVAEDGGHRHEQEGQHGVEAGGNQARKDGEHHRKRLRNARDHARGRSGLLAVAALLPHRFLCVCEGGGAHGPLLSGRVSGSARSWRPRPYLDPQGQKGGEDHGVAACRKAAEIAQGQAGILPRRGEPFREQAERQDLLVLALDGRAALEVELAEKRKQKFGLGMGTRQGGRAGLGRRQGGRDREGGNLGGRDWEGGKVGRCRDMALLKSRCRSFPLFAPTRATPSSAPPLLDDVAYEDKDGRACDDAHGDQVHHVDVLDGVVAAHQLGDAQEEEGCKECAAAREQTHEPAAEDGPTRFEDGSVLNATRAQRAGCVPARSALVLVDDVVGHDRRQHRSGRGGPEGVDEPVHDQGQVRRRVRGQPKAERHEHECKRVDGVAADLRARDGRLQRGLGYVRRTQRNRPPHARTDLVREDTPRRDGANDENLAVEAQVASGSAEVVLNVENVGEDKPRRRVDKRVRRDRCCVIV